MLTTKDKAGAQKGSEVLIELCAKISFWGQRAHLVSKGPIQAEKSSLKMFGAVLIEHRAFGAIHTCLMRIHKTYK